MFAGLTGTWAGRAVSALCVTRIPPAADMIRVGSHQPTASSPRHGPYGQHFLSACGNGRSGVSMLAGTNDLHRLGTKTIGPGLRSLLDLVSKSRGPRGPRVCVVVAALVQPALRWSATTLRLHLIPFEEVGDRAESSCDGLVQGPLVVAREPLPIGGTPATAAAKARRPRLPVPDWVSGFGP